MNYIHFPHCFLFLMLYRGLHNFSVCVHMLIWLACTTHTHASRGARVPDITIWCCSPRSCPLCFGVSISHWTQRWSWASWPAHPRALLFLSQAHSITPLFHLIFFVLFVGSGDGFQILTLVQQALYQPNCFPSSQWLVFHIILLDYDE